MKRRAARRNGSLPAVSILLPNRVGLALPVGQRRPRARTRALREASRSEISGEGRLRIDARQTCLKGSALAYRLTTDGRLTVLLSDGRRLALPAGTHTGTIAR